MCDIDINLDVGVGKIPLDQIIGFESEGPMVQTTFSCKSHGPRSIHRLSFDEKKCVSSGLDKFGMGISVVCLIHCLAVPLLMTFWPFLGFIDIHHHVSIDASVYEESVHLFLLLFILPISWFSWFSGYQKHGSKGVLLSGVLGLALIVLAFGYSESNLHAYVTCCGSFLMLVAHTLNLRYLKCCG